MKRTTSLIHTLRSVGELAVSTPDLVAEFGDWPNARSQVWAHLRRLQLAGVVKRTHRKGPNGSRLAFWRLVRRGQEVG